MYLLKLVGVGVLRSLGTRMTANYNVSALDVDVLHENASVHRRSIVDETYRASVLLLGIGYTHIRFG